MSAKWINIYDFTLLLHIHNCDKNHDKSFKILIFIISLKYKALCKISTNIITAVIKQDVQAFLGHVNKIYIHYNTHCNADYHLREDLLMYKIIWNQLKTWEISILALCMWSGLSVWILTLSLTVWKLCVSQPPHHPPSLWSHYTWFTSLTIIRYYKISVSPATSELKL